jgi:hypothetical protein
MAALPQLPQAMRPTDDCAKRDDCILHAFVFCKQKTRKQ